MANDDKAPNNVIQFPGRKREEEAKKDSAPPAAPKKPAKPRASKKTLGTTVLAIILFTGAVNNYVFGSRDSSSADFASVGSSPGRVIASIEKVTWPRDAAWEKQLAEKLASAQKRDVAAAYIGRPATKEEKLRWGVLEEKYTITYSGEEREIHSILLQDSGSAPAYILDRAKFLNEFGHLFEASFQSAKLKSVQAGGETTVESYTLYGKENEPKGEARFELDRHKRLISLKVEPVQI